MPTVAKAGIEDRYVYRTDETGSVYFILSQDMPCVKAPSSCSKLKFDCTYAQQTDSVRILATIKTDRLLNPDSVTVISEATGVIDAPAERLYINPKGKMYEYRIGFELPFDTFCRIFACPEPFILRYNFQTPGENDNGTDYEFGFKPGQWRKKSNEMTQINTIIKLNTNR